MTELVIKPAFNRGEIDPRLYGRVDVNAYQGGLATAKNCIVHIGGGISNRVGTTFIGPVKYHTDTAPRLKTFQFNVSDDYILEFGRGYIRFIRNGIRIFESTTRTITGISQTAPAVVTYTGDTIAEDAEVYITDVAGMTEVNNKSYKVSAIGSGTIDLASPYDDTDIDSTGFTTYTSGGTIQVIYEVSTPYLAEDVMSLRFSQNADSVIITHPDYAIRELIRTDHDDWTLDKFDLIQRADSATVQADYPQNVKVSAGTSGTDTIRYVVTATTNAGQETYVGRDTNELDIIAMFYGTDALTIQTDTNHGYVEGDEVILYQLTSSATELNQQRFLVSIITASKLALYTHTWEPINPDNVSTYTSGGKVVRAFSEITDSDNTDFDNYIQWNIREGSNFYSVYRESGRVGSRVYHWLGDTRLNLFKDDNITANVIKFPPAYRNPFLNGNNPGAVGYYQQRLVMGGSNDHPDDSYYSRTGRYEDFGIEFPLQDDSAITTSLSALEINRIRHYVSLKDLIIFTSGGEWVVNRGQANSFSPSSINQTRESNWGSAELTPEVVESTIIFLPPNSSDVRSMKLVEDFYVNTSLITLSKHLLNNNSIIDWTFVRFPSSRLYIATSDGCGLALSYNEEQEQVSWTRFDTDGSFLRAEKLLGGGLLEQDSVYWVIERRIDGFTNPVKYIEIMTENILTDVRDSLFLDCSLSLNSPVDICNLTFSSTVGITTETAHGLVSGDTIDIFDIKWEPVIDEWYNYNQPDVINTRRYTVINETETTFDLADLTGVAIDGSTFTTEYVSGGTVRKAFSTVSGLNHLEGQEVVCLCDGNVIRDKVISDGAISFSRKFSRIHIGLPYICDIETLNLETNDGSIQGIMKRIVKLTLRFDKTRSVLTGPNSSNMIEIKFRENEVWADPIALFSGDKEIIIPPEWNTNGKIFIRQKDPLPITLLAVIPWFDTEDGD